MTTIRPRCYKAVRLRREFDNTVYAYLCLNCGGAYKVYQNPICYCGAISDPNTKRVEGKWRKVKWDGKPAAL